MSPRETSASESNRPPRESTGRSLSLRATRWVLRGRTLLCGQTPLLMGIVNVTPDSFSDGGRFFDAGRAVEQALILAEQGADLLDIGGESTRPYSTPVSVAEERRRIEPVLRGVCRHAGVPVSIDTSKAEIARMALDAGAEVINDVTALTGDRQMIEVAARYGAGICLMHMRGTPQTMQDDPRYEDVVTEVYTYLQQRRDAVHEAGIPLERICLDPGIGFGKTHQHNLALLRHCRRFLQLGCPVLVGHSRKGFIAHVIGDRDADRTAGTIGVTLSLACQGIQVIRVHDPAAARQALQLFAATGGLELEVT